MKSRALIAALALTIFVATAYTVEAKHFGRGHGSVGVMGSKILGLKTLIELNLSDTQKSQLLSIIDKYEKDMEIARNNLRQARGNIRRVVEAEELNENDLRDACRLAAPIKEDLLVMGAKMKIELKKVLTTEQLQLLQERKARRMERMRDRLDSWFENHKD